MLVRLLEILPAVLFVILLARAVWRLFAQVPSAARRPRPSGTPQHGELMVRDPVCGTFVLPSRALSIDGGTLARYFCSEQCRAAYQAQAVSRDTQTDAPKRRGA